MRAQSKTHFRYQHLENEKVYKALAVMGRMPLQHYCSRKVMRAINNFELATDEDG